MFKKIRKYEIFNIAFVLIFSFFVLNLVYAQESREISTDSEMDERVIEAEMVLEKEIGSDGLKEVSETFDEIRKEVKNTEIEIRDEVKKGIDKNIIEIRKNDSTPSYEFQKVIDSERSTLYENVNNTLNTLNINNSDSLDSLAGEIEDSISRIQVVLEEKSGLETDFSEETRSIKNTILRLKDVIEEKRLLIEAREGDKIFVDTDNDGLSDYDEKFIYDTDPENSSTAGNGSSDSENVLNGINPKTGNPKTYSDPREDRESFVTESYKLEKISIAQDDGKKNILFEGVALPNSFVTLYIYSTPIIVTVKTTENGDWRYELDKELENGEHQMYVASVDNSGKIIARSNPISFTKTADAASIGIVGIDIETAETGDFVRDNFILISLAILIAVVVLALMFLGKEKNVKDTVNNLKKELDENNQK